MPTVKLTAAFCDRATVEPGKDRTIYWDQSLPGFGLRVTKAGHRSFIIQYRAGHGRAGVDRRLTIGGDIALELAKREARKLLGQTAAGFDPLQERREEAQRATGTLKAVCEAFLEREGAMVRHGDGTVTFGETRKLRSAQDRFDLFERAIHPVLGSKPIGDIKRSDLVRLLDTIEDERGPQAADNERSPGMPPATMTFFHRSCAGWDASRYASALAPAF
jgi:hypothetical protein